MTPDPILSRPITVGSLPSAGVEREIVATDAEREGLARAYGLREVRSLSADLTVTPGRDGIVAVVGHVRAEIVQSCVISLEPVEQSIDEEVSIRFAPEGSPAVPEPAKPGAEVMIDPEAADPPEPLSGPVLDLGAVTVEYFVLAIDPYPRAPGAEMPAELVEPPKNESDSPFAALARLTDKPAKSG